ncbi:MAG: hypothetical protein KGP28_04660, partial [Bdellovibrionales bacterium]|nr:hypothetical protein [Bdellovibrionales bacterium]
HYEHEDSFWYVVIAKDTSDESQIEIIDVFPTRDPELVALCRHGKKEVIGGGMASESASDEVSEKARKNVH